VIKYRRGASFGMARSNSAGFHAQSYWILRRIYAEN
jgi:hypothetical protein